MTRADDALENNKVLNVVLSNLTSLPVKVQEASNGTYEATLTWLDNRNIHGYLCHIDKNGDEVKLSSTSIYRLGLPKTINGALGYDFVSNYDYTDYYITLKLTSNDIREFHKLCKGRAYYEEALANRIINNLGKVVVIEDSTWSKL